MSKIQEVRVIKNVDIPMRDGVILRADLLMPVSEEPLPTLIVRTPYLKETFYTKEVYDVNVTAFRGYNILLCDTRGGGQSDGEFAPFVNEKNDGYDTIQWASKQPWCNGKVGTFGYSYNGGQQLLAAGTNPPALVCAAPGGASGEFLPTMMYGVLSHRTSIFWYMKQLRNALLSGKGDMTPELRKQKLDEIEYIMRFKNEEECYALPFLSADVLKFEGVPLKHFFDEWVENCDNEEYWKRVQPLGVENINVPCFFYTGWFDYMAPGLVDNYEYLSHKTDDPELAKKHRLVMGPWIHTTNYGMSTGSNSGIKYGDLNFPPNSGYTKEMYNSFMKFYDTHLKGQDRDDLAPVRIYVMGENVWRDEQEWPLARTQYTNLYLDSNGDARTCNGSGKLTFDAEFHSEADEYDYDPLNPCNNTELDLHKGIFKDRRCMQERQDTLVYCTDALEKEIEVTGNIQVRFFVKSSAVDTDFFVRLVDIQPDGKAIGLLVRPFRMRYREGLYHSKYMTPGEVYEVNFKLGPISMMFKPGHRICIEVTSSDFPEYDRNLNTDEAMGKGKNTVVAHQTILHTNEYPSHLILPIIPR